MKKEITVKISDRSITVRKLPLSKYSELLAALETLPQQLADFDGKSNEELLANLPKIISVALPEVVKVIAVAAEMEPEEVDELSLDEVVDLMIAIVEVNRIAEVAANIKKLLARKPAEA